MRMRVGAALVLFVGATISVVLSGSQPVSAVGKVSPGERRCFSVPGTPGDVALVNLTPVQAEGRGYGLLVSSDVAGVPVASNVNFDVGTTDPNVAAAAIGADGQVCYINSEAPTHLVADHLGTIDADAYTAAQANGAPLRKLDTRGGALLAPGARQCFSVAGSPGDVPLVNLTPVQSQGRGYGLLVSSDVVDVPVASSVNFDVGTTDPNVAAAAIGADGQVCYLNSEASTHLVADHLGTIDADSYTAAQASGAPLRSLDTRGGARLAPGARRCFSVAGSPGGVALVNLTPVQAQGRGYGLLVSSDVTEVPVASNVNFDVGTTDPNVAVAAIGADGHVCHLNSEASTHLVADHLGTIEAGVYTTAQANGAPDRRVDTRPIPPTWGFTALTATRPALYSDGPSIMGVAAAAGGGSVIAGNLTGQTTVLGTAVPPACWMYVGRVEADASPGWNKVFGCGFRIVTGFILTDEIRASQATPDGGLLVAGRYFAVEFDGLPSPNSHVSAKGDSFIAKISASGDWEWATVAGSPTTNWVEDLAVADDGTVIATGSIADSGEFRGLPRPPGASDYGDSFVATIGPTGKWQKTSRMAGTRHLAAVVAGDRVVIAGDFTGSQTESAVIGDTPVVGSGVFVMEGTRLGSWSTPTLAYGEDSSVRDVQVTSDGSPLVVGIFLRELAFNTVLLDSPRPSYSPFAALVGPHGGWNWARRLPEPGADGFADGSFLAPTEVGGALVVGRWSDGGSNPYLNARQAFVLELDSAGVVRWTKFVEGSGWVNMSASHVTPDVITLAGDYGVYSTIDFDSFRISSTDPFNNAMRGTFIVRLRET
jgi:hypothetical protein